MRSVGSAYPLAVPIDQDSIAKLDAKGYRPLLAHTPGRESSASYGKPRTFVCDDGKKYWLKNGAQSGLAAELIGGRLAKTVGAGPGAQIIVVPTAALPTDGSAADLEGLAVVGLENEANTVNRTQLEGMAPDKFDRNLIDAGSRALSVAFQTWIACGDGPQFLVNTNTGAVRSIDFGDCLPKVLPAGPPDLRVAPIPGVSNTLGADAQSVEAAVRKIEAVTDQQILAAVAQVPDDPGWDAAIDRRLAIANWLVERRSKVREVMKSWK